jgi:bla regulator protein blaR1
MRLATHLAAAFALFTLAGYAQTAQPRPELLLFHYTGPSLSYEVATIKPIDPATADRMVKLPPGVSISPFSIRRYIMNAYGAICPAQVVGGPDWLNKDAYDIKGKVPEDLEAAQQNMKFSDRQVQTRSMQQSLLADRFHLKAHFETRVLPVYEIVPAKGGLKITEVPAPPERKTSDQPIRLRPNDPLPPGSSMTMLNSSGQRVFNGHAIKMQALIRPIGPDAGDRPIVDHTGFTGYFDVKDLTWAPVGDASANSSTDAPSLGVALEEKLGLKIIPAKAPIEVLVIDSIDRPTEN